MPSRELECLIVEDTLIACNKSKEKLKQKINEFKTKSYKIEKLNENLIYDKFIESKRMLNGELFSYLVNSLKEHKSELTNEKLKDLV